MPEVLSVEDSGDSIRGQHTATGTNSTKGTFLPSRFDGGHMSDFDLDLRTAEEHIEEDVEIDGSIVLDVLDGTTSDDEWLEILSSGNALVLCVEGEVNELASGFARDVKEAGGNLVHFRGFLVVTPPGVDVNTDRL